MVYLLGTGKSCTSQEIRKLIISELKWLLSWFWFNGRNELQKVKGFQLVRAVILWLIRPAWALSIRPYTEGQ